MLDGEAEQMRRVEAVHRRPAVGSITEVARDAFIASDRDERGDEAVVAVAVIGRRESYDRRTDTAGSEREDELGGGPARSRAFAIGTP